MICSRIYITFSSKIIQDEAIADICHCHNAWHHLDGAFGLYARCSPWYAHLAQGSQLADWIEASNSYQLLLPPTLNVVLFAGKFEGDLESVSDRNRALLQTINQTGRVFLTPGNYHGQFCFRAAFSNWRTNTEDIAVCDSNAFFL